MSGDIKKFIEEQRRQILEEKKRLGVSEHSANRQKDSNQDSFDPHLIAAASDKNNKDAAKHHQKNRVECKNRENNFSEKQENLREKADRDDVKNSYKPNNGDAYLSKKDKENNANFDNTAKYGNAVNSYNNNDYYNSTENVVKNDNNAKAVNKFKDTNHNKNKLNKNNENNKDSDDISSDYKSNKFKGYSDSELRLDLKDLTEDSEEKEDIIFGKNPYVDASIGKAKVSDTRLVDCEGLFDVDKSDASTDFHARSGVKFTPDEGVASMDYAPLLPRPILRRGEYSHHFYADAGCDDDSTRSLRGAGSTSLLRAEPHCGLGEYELSRALFAERRRRDYLRHLAKVQYDLRTKDSSRKAFSPRTVTDDLVDSAYRKRPYRRVDQRLTSAENELLLSGGCESVSKTGRMDKPKSILSNRRTGSPRNRYGASNSYDDYESAYSPTSFMDGFSYSDRNDDLERERLKRENYQHELRMQIEEKRRLQEMRAEQERRERELENKRLEQQILRIREEAAMEDSKTARRNEMMRRHSDDLMRRKHELQMERRSWRRHADSESGALDTLGLGAGSSSASHYSPPVARRVPYSFNVPATSVFADSSARYNPGRYESSSYSSILRNRDTSLNRVDTLNSYDTSTVPFSHRSRKFDRFDSLSRIDSLTHRLDSMNVRDEGYTTSARLTDIERRHSATQQDLSLSSRRSPRSRRRNSSSRFEDTMPIPVLKARSPVAKELKNSVPFSSAVRSSDIQRRLEDRWQIPAVQKTILHTSVSQPESPSGHQSRGSILTQLGAIRSQLQREQLRMDESLRRRGLPRARSTDYGGY